MAKKPKEKQLPPPLPSPSSSSDDEESPPPAISPVKKPSSVATTALQQNRIAGQKNEDEEDSTDDELSEDSRAAAENVDPATQPRDSRISNGKEGLSNYFSSDTESEDVGGDGEEVDSGSESEKNVAPSSTHEAANAEGKKAATTLILGSKSTSEDDSESSSDSDIVAAAPRSSLRNAADLSLKPLSSKPMDSPASISRKRSNTTPAQVSEKRRKVGAIVEAERGQEKKEITRRIWSKADELALLQCILDHNERHQGTANPVQVESLLKLVNNSLSSAVTLTQMNDKIRRLRQKYNATIKKENDANNPNISNVHDAACFELSRKIWGPGQKEPVFTENNFKPEKVKKAIEEKRKTNHLAVEYPLLRWIAENDHADIALVVPSHIPTAEAKELERSCKKLELTEIQLHIQKTKYLSSSLKLIEDALAKL